MRRVSTFNPQAFADRLMLRNAAAIALQQIWVSALLLLVFALVVVLFASILISSLAQSDHWMTVALDRYPAVTWTVVFVISLGSLKSMAHRQQAAATAGWLAALPQMPHSAQRYSARLLCLAGLIQIMLLVGLLSMLMLSPDINVSLPVTHWLLALGVPIVATVIVLRFSPFSSLSTGQWRAHRTQRQPSKLASTSLAGTIRQWQWSAFQSVLWTPAVRWVFGGLLLLIPVGASTVAVAVTLFVGWVAFQAANTWTAWMRTIVSASRLLRAVPTRTRSLLWALSVLPLTLALVSSVMLFLGLLALGADFALAILIMMSFQSLAVLVLAAVLAWRHEPRVLQWRIAATVLAWVFVAQSLMPAAPLVWLALMAFLLKRAGRR